MPYRINHFSLSLPKGEGQSDLAGLLRHLAKNIEKEGPLEVMDIVFHNETDEEGAPWPSFTVYYEKSKGK